MLVRKTAVANLEVGKVYVAYSSKSKMLSSNEDKGMFVLVEEVKGKDVKINILSLNKTMTVKNLDERNDAWIYSPDSELKLFVNAEGKRDSFPKFTDRMFDAFQGKEVKFSPDHIYKHEREGEGNGMLFYRFRGDDDKMNTFNFAWIVPNVSPEWRIPRAQRMGVGAVEVALPPKPVSVEEETLIEFLSASIKTFNENKKLNATASFVILNKDGKVIKSNYSGACHYDLKEIGWGGKYVISSCQAPKGFIDKNILSNYITYLTTLSPFKDAFLIKNADWIMKNGYVLTGDVSAQLLCGACIATRQAWEYSHFIKAWKGLADQGIPLNLSYLFGAYAVGSGSKWSWGAGSTGHTVFSLNRMENQHIINFNDGKVVKENKEPYTENSNYSGVDYLWGTGDKQADVFNKLRQIGGAGKYGTSKPIAFEDAMEQAADIIEDWMKKESV